MHIKNNQAEESPAPPGVVIVIDAGYGGVDGGTGKGGLRDIPGGIVETAFISNNKERKLLAEDGFRTQLAQAMAEGVERYLYQQGFLY